ncbi:MAG: NAD-binding protein [Planctomycetota bacterium]|jgi:CPA2 family monovalent cation:H+ antiporter-2
MTQQPRRATFRDGRVELNEPVDWPDGTELEIVPMESSSGMINVNGPVIIAGFGLSGRCVADLLDSAGIEYVVIEKNPSTVEIQRALGRSIIEGDVTDASTLMAAKMHSASMLALTIPDEEAVLRATSLARKLRPEIFIIARTTHASKGMQASQLGADKVIKAEQAVAIQFYEHLSKRLARES